MNKNKPIILLDPYPRTMDLLFSKENLNYLKKKFKLITAPNKNKNNFYSYEFTDTGLGIAVGIKKY